MSEKGVGRGLHALAFGDSDASATHATQEFSTSRKDNYMAIKKAEMLESIVNSGSELEILKGLRTKIANTIDSTNSGRDVAALSKQMREVSARISELENSMYDAKNITALDLILLKSELQDRKSELQDRKQKSKLTAEEEKNIDLMLEAVSETLDVFDDGENDGLQED